LELARIGARKHARPPSQGLAGCCTGRCSSASVRIGPRRLPISRRSPSCSASSCAARSHAGTCRRRCRSYGYLRTEAIAANILPVGIPSFHRRWHGDLALFRYRRGPGGPGRRSSSKLPAPPHRSAAPAISRCVRHQPAVRQRHSQWACGMACLRSSPPRHLARAIDQAQGFRRRDQARANARGASFLNVISMEQCDLNGTLAAQRFDET
jgi:hypothetical protein